MKPTRIRFDWRILMSALLILGLVQYGFVAFESAHADAQPSAPVAAINVRIVGPHEAHANHTHSGSVVHVHVASLFVAASASALSVAANVDSVAYQRLQAAQVITREGAPPLRPPRSNL